MRFLSLLTALFLVSSGYADELALGKKCPKPILGPQEPHKDQAPLSQKPMPSKQGDEPLSEDRYLPSYNAPAAVALKGQTYNYYVDGSYLYWQASQEGMDIAHSNGLSASIEIIGPQASILYQPFSYQSGFKAGLGFSGDNGTLDAHYTWIRQSTSISRAAPESGVPGATDVWVSPWILDPWVAGSDVDSEWKLGMDLFDLSLGRPYYQGPFVTVNPFVGLRGALIRQYLHLHQNAVVNGSHVTAATLVHDHNVCQSWGIGPRTGVTSSYVHQSGFRIFGDLAASLLFTQYTQIGAKTDRVSDTSSASYVGGRVTNLNVLRPELELGLGLGWGIYTPSQRFHFDLAASYDFAIFWSQNMMRYLVDNLGSEIGASPANLYLQGLTVTAGFAF